MDSKTSKLVNLYKDNSITIEEKRSIAVKLVDDLLKSIDNKQSINKQSYVNNKQTLRYIVDREVYDH